MKRSTSKHVVDQTYRTRNQGRRQQTAASMLSEPPIRVCFIIDRLFTGGTELQLLGILNTLDRSRVEPYLCLLDGEDEVSRSLEPDSIPIQRLGIRSLKSFSTLKSVMAFRKFLKSNRIDIVQTYFEDSSFYGVLAARLARVPRVVRTRFRLGDPSLSRRILWSSRIVNQLVDGVIANAQATQDSMVAEEWIPPERFTIIPNGIQLERFLATPEVLFDGSGHTPVRIGMVSNPCPVKDPELLLAVAQELSARNRNIRFRVAGDGELLTEMRRKVAALGLQERVEFLGKVQDIPAFLASVDLTVLTSSAEGFPNAVIEYMASGRAVVATAVGGIVELIEPGKHGLLVPAGDVPAFVEAIERLLDSPERACQLARAGRERVASTFSRSIQVNRYTAYYQSLMNR